MLVHRVHQRRSSAARSTNVGSHVNTEVGTGFVAFMTLYDDDDVDMWRSYLATMREAAPHALLLSSSSIVVYIATCDRYMGWS